MWFFQASRQLLFSIYFMLLESLYRDLIWLSCLIIVNIRWLIFIYLYKRRLKAYMTWSVGITHSKHSGIPWRMVCNYKNDFLFVVNLLKHAKTLVWPFISGFSHSIMKLLRFFFNMQHLNAVSNSLYVGFVASDMRWWVESAVHTCWHTALSWNGCHHERAEVTGTAWKWMG